MRAIEEVGGESDVFRREIESVTVTVSIARPPVCFGKRISKSI
jgi:hypothetical protein